MNKKKQSMILMLNDISKNIDIELGIIKESIDNQNKTLQNQIVQLKDTTNEIVVTQETITENEKEINELSSREESLSSELRSLDKQILELKIEIDELEKKIQEQLPKLDPGSIIERILNPLSVIKDLIDHLNNNIKECSDRIKSNIETIEQRVSEADIISKKRFEIESKLQDLKNSIIQLNITRETLEISVKQLGIEKTNSENLKLQFGELQIKCKLLLDQVETEKDLVDMDIESDITEFVKQVNTALSNVKNGAMDYNKFIEIKDYFTF